MGERADGERGGEAQVRRLLAKVPGLDGEHATVAPLSGGITNENFRVEARGVVLVVRLAGRNSDLLGIDRRHEHAASRVAADLGIGADVVAFFDEDDALVTRFVEGRAVTSERAAERDFIARAAMTLRAFHHGPPFPGEFSVFETVRSYHREALRHGVSFPPTAPASLTRAAEFEGALRSRDPSVPCHNDLLAANFIETPDLRVLDWEYAGMGDRFFDLGNYAANQRLDAAACEFLLESYAGAVERRALARLHLLRILSDLRESLWGFLQSGISTLDFDFHAYGREHLERFEEASAAPAIAAWLEDARSA